MVLSDRLAALEASQRRKGIVAQWLDTLSDPDRSLVLTYMRKTNDDIPHRSLLRALQEEGAPFGRDALISFRHELWKNNDAK